MATTLDDLTAKLKKIDKENAAKAESELESALEEAAS